MPAGGVSRPDPGNAGTNKYGNGGPFMQEEKKKLINDVLDDGYNSANILKSLSSEELKSLFI